MLVSNPRVRGGRLGAAAHGPCRHAERPADCEVIVEKLKDTVLVHDVQHEVTDSS